MRDLLLCGGAAVLALACGPGDAGEPRAMSSMEMAPPGQPGWSDPAEPAHPAEPAAVNAPSGAPAPPSDGPGVPSVQSPPASAPNDPTLPSDPPGRGYLPARCLGDASRTVMVGDSYLALTGEVTVFLSQHTGQTYRTYYVSGTQMVGGLPPTIPDQARTAISEGPVETIIMDGGGNDVLVGDLSCRVTGPAPGSTCEATIHDALGAAAALIDEAAALGVREVIYFFYPHVPPGLLSLGNDMLNAVLDYAAPLARSICEGAAAVDCRFIDLRDPFAGHPEYIGGDGVHPTTPGSEVIAGLIWDVMDENCRQGLDVPTST